MLNNWWENGEALGNKKASTRKQKRQVRLSNLLSLIFFLLIAISTTAYALYGLPKQIWWLMAFALALWGVPLANRLGRHAFARHLLFVLLYLYITTASLMLGNEAGIFIYYFPASIISFVLIGPKRTLHTRIAMLAVVVCTVLWVRFGDWRPLLAGHLSPQAEKISYAVWFVSAVVASALSLFYVFGLLKKSEEKAKRERTFYQSILDGLPTVIVVFDTQYRSLFINKTAMPDDERRAAFLGKSDLEVTLATGADEIKARRRHQIFKQVLATGHPVTFEEEHRSPQAHRYYLSSLIPLADARGKVNAVIGVRNDISEVKRTQAHIKKSQELFKTIFNTTTDALFISEIRTSKIQDCNLGAVRLLEATRPADLIGTPGNRYVADDMAKHYATAKQQMAEQGKWQAELPFQTCKGRTFIGSVVATYLTIDDKQRVLVRITDISREVHLRNELRRAKEKAEEAARARSEFLSRMSHEIRTPLNAVIGLTSFMLAHPETRDTENLRQVRVAGEHLLGIVNDILDFSKLDADKISINPAPLQLREVMQNALATGIFLAEEKGLQLGLFIDLQVPDEVVGDALRLQQILVNLIANAIKFTEKGRVDVRVNAPHAWEQEVALRFEVEDTGIGIPDDKKKAIFESFSQASPDISLRYGGTGLGLAIVQKLVHMMGGNIEVHDSTEGGSLFVFNLVMQANVQSTLQPLPKLPMNATENDKNLSGVRLLVAEDNKVNQFVAKQILSKWNATIDLADNGQHAVDLFHQKEYDVILMDLQMPVMDGFEATRLIRQAIAEAQRKATPIVALTADIMPDTRQRVRESGMDDIIIKPFELDELYNVISLYAKRQS